ncbi:MAG: 1-acyl-sn-glycerol-3-phosphate acyltransferase [Armatimonadetes bacterium]|nr:1-acyl-sn-glycerol-3-phosphate acyltransferase [Armatimonadota bacterium]
MRHALYWLTFYLAYAFCKVFFGLALRFPFLAWIRIENRHRMPRRGGLIVIANHRSLADPVVLWYASPRHLCFMGRADILQIPIISAIARLVRMIPVRQRSADRRALMEAIQAVQRGEALCIFPEGELSETGELMPFLPGVLLILRQTKAPVLPVGLMNTEKLVPYGKLYPKVAFTVITVRFGEVIPAEQVLALPDTEAQLEFLREQVRRLVETDP